MIGSRFGEFQVLRRIAGGLVANVFLASDGSEVCAVKVFSRSFADRAEREFTFGRDLDHTRLNRVDALLELDGRATVRMPFVPGVQLSRWLPMHGSRRMVTAVVADVLDALSYLHGRGVVHRDVKPENILVGRDDRPVLIDFDLAARIGERTVERGWAGTAAYLSPARARGESASPADDLYSVGVVLYWALTGGLPFEGDFDDVLAAHRTLVAPAPSGHDHELAVFDRWMERALAKRSPEGFTDATQMKAALEALAGDIVP